jgi:CRP/FNR family transcriptional regulator, nitrogen oxide reductase regulator
MNALELSSVIKKLRPPLLDGMQTRALSDILGAARARRFLARSIITNQGHPADHLFLLLSGGARCFFFTPNGRKLSVYSFPPGEMFGGMALVERPSEYIVSTEAMKDSQTLIWERNTIRDLARQYPKLVENTLTIASDYLNMTIATQVALSCHTARQRLAEVLVRLASGVGHRGASGIELHVRNEELADAANLTLFTVSRLMSEWQRGGLLKKSRGKVLLSSPERLLLQDI